MGLINQDIIDRHAGAATLEGIAIEVLELAVDQRVAVRRVTVAARVIDLEHPLMARKGTPIEKTVVRCRRMRRSLAHQRTVNCVGGWSPDV